MRAYSVTVVKVLYCLSLAALAGCVSSGAKPPGANAPCKTDDGCPSGYQCLPATTGAPGSFCCKDKNSCGSTGTGGAGGTGIDGAIVLDGPSSKGGAGGGIDRFSAGGGTGSGEIGRTGGIVGAGGLAGTGGVLMGGSPGVDVPLAT